MTTTAPDLTTAAELAAIVATLADALDGNPLSHREARQIAADLRRITAHLPPGRDGAHLAKDLTTTAELLDAQADHHYRPR